MRQKNTPNITIHSLTAKKKSDPKPQKPMKMKTVVIPGDNMHTKFIVPASKDSQEVINRYLNSRKYK